MNKIIRFIFSGGIAASTEYCSFLALINIVGFDVLVSNILSFLVGLVVSFTLNKKWVFKSDNSVRREFVNYLLLAFINVFLGTLIMVVMVDVLNILYFVSKIIIMILIAFWNYLLFSRYIFNK